MNKILLFYICILTTLIAACSGDIKVTLDQSVKGLSYDLSAQTVTLAKIIISKDTQIVTIAGPIASDGSTLKSFTVIGSLPPGLTMNTSTGAITGTPSAVGDYIIIVKAESNIANTSYTSTSLTFTVEDTVVSYNLGLGEVFSCGFISGDIYCSGLNFWGGIGDATNTDRSASTLIDKSGSLSGKTITRLFVGLYQSCLQTSDKGIQCWGTGDDGALGNGTFGHQNTPTPINTTGVLSGKIASDVSVGYGHAVLLTKNENKVYTWGYNSNGQLGNNTTAVNAAFPGAVVDTGALSGKTFIQVNAGYNNTLLLSSDHLLYSFGSNVNGELGNNSNTDSPVPVAVNLSNLSVSEYVTEIVPSKGHHQFFKTNLGNWYGFGKNDSSQLGDSSFSDKLIPTKLTLTGVAAGKIIKQLVTGLNHTCILTTDLNVYCVGSGASGQLGNGAGTNSNIWVSINRTGELAGKTPLKLTAANLESCVKTLEDSKWYCWGLNNYAQLGNTTYIQTNSPTLSFGGLTF